MVGPDRVIYFYGNFDPERNEMLGLTMFTPRADRWALASQTFVRRAVFGADGWIGEQGWRQDFKTDPPTWTNIARAPSRGWSRRPTSPPLRPTPS